MPKTRIQKEEILATTIDRLHRAASVVLLPVQKVKVSEFESVRDALFPGGLQLQVSKNNLLKLALKECNLEIPPELLDQSLALVYSYNDPVAAAKILFPFVKDIDALEFLGGLMDGAFLTPDQVLSLARLPSRDQLLARVVGSLVSPLSGLIRVLHGNIRNLVLALGQVRDQKT